MVAYGEGYLRQTNTPMLRDQLKGTKSALCCAILLMTANVVAQDDEIVVIGVTPMQNVGVSEDKIPYNVQSALAEDIENAQSTTLSDFLVHRLGGVSYNDAQNNPLQPDIRFRGYTASPLLGLAQGLAIYQNGVRINEPLGDTINWDLVPQSAIHSLTLIGGTNPVFGLNTLGGALAIRMKNGFNAEGHELNISGGSFERIVVSAESGGNAEGLAYFANIQYFDEGGWRDLSESDALNFYGSIGWLGSRSDLNLNFQHGVSHLLGNGPAPVELLAVDRSAIFTAPDRTENDMTMISIDGSLDLRANTKLTANLFYRNNETDSFNGDTSEFVICDLGGLDTLLEGLEDDHLEDIGLADDDVCEGQFADAEQLEDFLNAAAMNLALESEFNINDLSDELSGTGVLAGEAINNISNRNQESLGSDLQLMFGKDLFNRSNELVLGLAYFYGDSRFDSVTELSGLDSVTRSTERRGTGTFVTGLETSIDTGTETLSVYFVDVIEMTDRLTLTVSGRYNDTDVELRDRSGERPELNGKHNFSRFNPALGVTYQLAKNANVYGSYSESSRAPTPIELACNDAIFDLAVASAIAAGEDPDDVEFECRLPNAFLADPPLEQVVTRTVETGIRGETDWAKYHLGLFHSANDNDIIFQTTGRSTGLFANVNGTRRLGFEGLLSGTVGDFSWSLAYTYLEATFEDEFNVLSPNHPHADEEGEINVRSGDRLPGLPEHSSKFSGDYAIGDRSSIGLDVQYNSDLVLRGDESNQLDTLDGHLVVNLRGRYRVNDNIELYARVANLFDEEYETFGLLGEEPSEVEVPLFEDFSIPRFVGPAAPRAVFVGISLRAN